MCGMVMSYFICYMLLSCYKKIILNLINEEEFVSFCSSLIIICPTMPILNRRSQLYAGQRLFAFKSAILVETTDEKRHLLS